MKGTHPKDIFDAKQRHNRTMDSAVDALESRNHLVERIGEYHLRVNGIDFWPTTSKWYDAHTGIKSKGMRSFIRYIESKEDKDEV